MITAIECYPFMTFTMMLAVEGHTNLVIIKVIFDLCCSAYYLELCVFVHLSFPPYFADY